MTRNYVRKTVGYEDFLAGFPQRVYNIDDVFLNARELCVNRYKVPSLATIITILTEREVSSDNIGRALGVDGQTIRSWQNGLGLKRKPRGGYAPKKWTTKVDGILPSN